MTQSSAGGQEPSWHAAFEPRSDAVHSPFPVSRSGWRLTLELGASGEPPSLAERDGVVVLVEGPLFDRGALAARFRGSLSQSDAELVLAGYREVADALIPELRGSFGLVVWDAPRDRFLCARDPTGSQPLYFARLGGRVFVAASQPALLAVPEVPDEIDRITIADWIVSSGCPQRATFYSAIERLPAGHRLVAERGEVSVGRYWHPSSAGDVGPDEALSRFEELLDQALRRCASLGPIGIFLSGGADSAAVAASATVVSRNLGLPDPVALSYVFPYLGANEEVAQRAIADGLGIPQYLVGMDDAVDPDGLLPTVLRSIEQYPIPCGNPWQVVYNHLLREGARRGCRVIVSGDGGNPWFENEWLEAADLLLRLRFLELRRWWSEERQQRSRRSLVENLLWRFGARPLVREAFFAALAKLPGDSVRDVRKRRLAASVGPAWVMPDPALREAALARWAESDPSLAGVHFREWGRRSSLEGNWFAIGHEIQSALNHREGTRTVDPPLDPDLVAFMFSLPRSVINLGGVKKGLARAAIGSRAGAGAAAAIGVAVPSGFFAMRARTEVPRALEQLGGVKRLADLGIVDERAFVESFSEPGQSGSPQYHRVWETLSCEAWLRGHN